MTLREIQKRAWQIAEDKGFHEELKAHEPRHATMIRTSLIHTEISEALEELYLPLEAILRLLQLHRTTSNATQLVKKFPLTEIKEALGKELADIVIRAADLAELVTIDLQDYIEMKQAYNATRPNLYGTPHQGDSHD